MTSSAGALCVERQSIRSACSAVWLCRVRSLSPSPSLSLSSARVAFALPLSRSKRLYALASAQKYKTSRLHTPHADALRQQREIQKGGSAIQLISVRCLAKCPLTRARVRAASQPKQQQHSRATGSQSHLQHLSLSLSFSPLLLLVRFIIRRGRVARFRQCI